MIRVEQQRPINRRTGEGGDCVLACVASIFHLPLEEVDLPVPPCAQDLFRWTNEHMPFLRYNERDFCTNYRIAEGEGTDAERWEYDLPDPTVEYEAPVGPNSYYMGFFVSPRGKIPKGPYRGMPAQHAVVMRDGDVMWDPHPKRKQGLGPMVGMGWWTRVNRP